MFRSKHVVISIDFFLQAAQGVVLAFHNLNRPEFTLMLTALPPTYQVDK